MEEKMITIIDNHNKEYYYEVPVDAGILGEGGSGTVRRGCRIEKSTGHRRDVAIKFLYDDLRECDIKRARREASIRIRHENLIEMIDFIETGEEDEIKGKSDLHYHVVSELLHGIMLLDLINGKVTPEQISDMPVVQELVNLMQINRELFAIKVVSSVLSGIASLHDKGYVHRDIDPSNIMITEEGKIKIIDLGIAKKVDSISDTKSDSLFTVAGQFMGKAPYAAPELAIGDLQHQNAQTDIYAIGILLFQLVTGELPFDGPVYEVLQMQKECDMPVGKIVNKGIRKIVKKATEKRQSERYLSASEFRVAIDRITIGDKISNPGMSVSIPDWAVYGISAVLGAVVGIAAALKF